MLIPPDSTTLERRLRGRGTETEEVIARRLRKAKEEIARAAAYDYIIVNEDGGAAQAAQALLSVVQAEQLRAGRCADERIRAFLGA